MFSEADRDAVGGEGTFFWSVSGESFCRFHLCPENNSIFSQSLNIHCRRERKKKPLWTIWKLALSMIYWGNIEISQKVGRAMPRVKQMRIRNRQGIYAEELHLSKVGAEILNIRRMATVSDNVKYDTNVPYSSNNEHQFLIVHPLFTLHDSTYAHAVSAYAQIKMGDAFRFFHASGDGMPNSFGQISSKHWDYIEDPTFFGDWSISWPSSGGITMEKKDWKKSYCKKIVRLYPVGNFLGKRNLSYQFTSAT